MKTPVAITIIIMSALLIMTPALSDYLYQRNVVELMNRPGVSSVTLGGQMTEMYRFGCWLTGSVMAGIAILSSLGGRKSTEAHERAGTLRA